MSDARRTEWHRCDGCGRRERLAAGKRHTCRCHPAGFPMVSDSVRGIAASAVRAMAATQRRSAR